MTIRVLRIYHGGRDSRHRSRERALTDAGVDVTLVVPTRWAGPGQEADLSTEPFRVVELPAKRSGDVNRHSYIAEGAARQLLLETNPDVLDIHEEPFSAAARQWLRAAPRELPVVMYSAQNVDKRYPPPFWGYERAAHRRVSAFYPCSSQAASVLRGKGFDGAIKVLPLGYDGAVFRPGVQSIDSDEIVMLFAGRLVAEKGVFDAVELLARLNERRPARLLICGDGPEKGAARNVAVSRGVAERVAFLGWQDGSGLASMYRGAHVALVPSRPTETWVEQFGRAIVEAQACGTVVAGYASGSIPEVAGTAGVIVPVGEIDQLATALVQLTSDRDEFKSRRDLGQRQAADRTWEAVASQQLELYRAVVGTRPHRPRLPRSPRARRAAAHAEFGPTAPTSAGVRPFAVPIARHGGALANGVARAIDAVGEAVALMPPGLTTLRDRTRAG